MPHKRTKRTPSLRHHKPSHRAFVEIEGQRRYLGKFGSPEAQQAYDRTVAEWLANGRRMPVEASELRVVELCARYLDHAAIHYRKADGTPTSELRNVQRAVKELRTLYGELPVIEFGPLQLKAIQHGFVEAKQTRKTVNHYTAILKRLFKWSVSESLAPVEVHTRLATVEGLRAGRTRAKESKPVQPVPMAHVNAIRPYVSRQIWGLIQLQLHTAARPGELLKLRPIDFDTSSEPWQVHLGDHKTVHTGRQRVILFGPQARDIIREFMRDRPIHDFMFSPREAERERHAKAGTHRRVNQKVDEKLSDREVGEHYDTASYGRAITRACKKADVPVWSPNRLRHNSGTFVRKEHGLEAAQVILGHSKLGTTQVYAERDLTKAAAVIEEIG